MNSLWSENLSRLAIQAGIAPEELHLYFKKLLPPGMRTLELPDGTLISLTPNDQGDAVGYSVLHRLIVFSFASLEREQAARQEGMGL